MAPFIDPFPRPCLALVLEPEALAVDTDDYRVVRDPIEHRDGEHAVTRAGSILTAKAANHRARAVSAFRYIETWGWQCSGGSEGSGI